MFEREPKGYHSDDCSSDISAMIRIHFSEDEWENRHDLHEADCSRALTKGRQTFGEIHCDCNQVTHARYCPECNKPKIEAEAKIVPA